MKLLTDENFPLPSVRMLRQAGHDVIAVQEVSPGVADRAVLAQAVAEQRILLTFDRDYGELIYRFHEPAPPAILYFRQGLYTPLELARSAENVLGGSPDELIGQFIILTPQTIRRKPLP